MKKYIGKSLVYYVPRCFGSALVTQSPIVSIEKTSIKEEEGWNEDYYKIICEDGNIAYLTEAMLKHRTLADKLKAKWKDQLCSKSLGNILTDALKDKQVFIDNEWRDILRVEFTSSNYETRSQMQILVAPKHDAESNVTGSGFFIDPVFLKTTLIRDKYEVKPS